MSEALVLPVIALLLLATAGIVVWGVRTAQRNRRRFAEHPEQRPYGANLLLRVSPFFLISAACAVYGFVSGATVTAVLGVAGVVLFVVEVVRRWNPPDRLT